MVPESGEPPTAAGETGEHGAVEALQWPPETDARSEGGGGEKEGVRC